MINSCNQPVKILSLEDQLCIYIGLLWAHRRSMRVRLVIRSHCDRIRRWRAGVPGSLGMSFSGRDPCAGDEGVV